MGEQGIRHTYARTYLLVHVCIVDSFVSSCYVIVSWIIRPIYTYVRRYTHALSIVRRGLDWVGLFLPNFRFIR